METQAFLTAEWRFLAMANYEIDPAILQPFLPRGTELDTWQGRHYASIVGFLFLDTRVLGWPIPFHRNFEELNLRFYVRRRGPEGWRRGVVFVKELVPRWAISTVARLAYNENYETYPMRHHIERATGDPFDLAANGSVKYEWRVNSEWQKLVIQTVGAAQTLTSDSEAEFITEHYWGYAAQRDGGCVEYQVEHPPWRVWQAANVAFDCNVVALYGSQFAETFQAAPFSAFVAQGSPITVRRGVRIN